MKRKKIDILFMQETIFSQEVNRKHYTWMLSGSDEGNFTHYGVGIVYRNEFRDRVVDKEAGTKEKVAGEDGTKALTHQLMP